MIYEGRIEIANTDEREVCYLCTDIVKYQQKIAFNLLHTKDVDLGTPLHFTTYFLRSIFLLWNRNHTTVNYVTWWMQDSNVGRQEMSSDTSMFGKIGSLMI